MLFIMKVSRLGMEQLLTITENSAIYLGLLKKTTFGDIILFIGQISWQAWSLPAIFHFPL